MLPRLRTLSLACAVALWGVVNLPAFASDEPTCAARSAELTTAENVVEVRRGGAATWERVTTGARVCFGDTLRTAAFSRATVTLPDFTTLRLDAHTTFALREPASAQGSLIDLIRGVIHVISRDPRSLSFRTPYANAGLEGTEFDIRVDDADARTEVVVLEGDVVVTAPTGTIGVTRGNIARVQPNAPPSAAPVSEPIELMRWAGHYPPIIDAALPAPEQEPPADGGSATFFAARAAARLATAQLDAARRDLATAHRLEPRNATALALEAVVALSHGDRVTATRLADEATAGTTPPASAFIALSHVQETAGDATAAAHSIGRALEIEPNNARALTRFAEVALATGDTDTSLAYAARAATLAPLRSAPATVRGFAALRQLDLAAARIAFEHAVALEPADPLPHLGLALTLAQQGNLVAGRQILELAVALDPGNAMTRSYMAKIYNTENRESLTSTQLDLAMGFDPHDPTPWLYSAMQKLRSNRPIEALQDLRAAAERNANRTVSRSSLRVDDDAATRSGGVSRIHDEIGFDKLALVSAWRATVDDPADYAAHRVLGDIYGSTPRHEIARTSEMLVAQLLQPLNVTPIKAQLGQQPLFIAGRAGPSDLSFNELSAPIVGNGLQLQASAASAGNSTLGEDVTIAGIHDELSYSVGQYRFASDGFRDNNDIDQRTASAFVQYRPSARTSVQGELRSTRTESGDLGLRFNPDVYNENARSHDTADAFRVSARHDLTAQRSLLASAIVQRSASSFFGGPIFSLSADGDAHSVDVQLLERRDIGTLQYGFRYGGSDHLVGARYSLPVPGSPPPTTVDVDLDESQVAVYGYAHLKASDALTITVGASVDRPDNRAYVTPEEALNPKLGLLWLPTERTTVRVAAFSALYASLTTSRQNPQPRLEPVHVAGFSQALFGTQGDESNVTGFGVDHAVSARVYLGYEATRRDSDRFAVDPSSGTPRVLEYEFDERSQEAYVYGTVGDRVSLTARYESSRFRSAPLHPQSFVELNLDRLPIEARYFSPNGLTAGLRASHVRERGQFEIPTALGAPSAYAPGEDRFWVLDAFVGYRLPNRRGFVSLNADNLLDQTFRFQDVDPEVTSIMPERFLSLRFTVAFD